MKYPVVTFGKKARGVLRSSLIEVCTHRGWQHHESAVRTNHVHVVVSVQRDPEFIMNSFKAWGTQKLVEASLFAKGAKIRERHGSTRYLWSMDDLVGACNYVREMQGGDLD
jgi:REP element-mobilizing transposase RayT